ncbi:hypothetical protein QFZ72_000448 [Bacillus sp. V2I10]|nr:hypothetical protein [Bacillus sp. V2I10]
MASNEPKSSSKPKFSNRGSNNPAKKNTENKIGRRSFKRSPPVFSDQIHSGPILNKVRTAKTAPINRAKTHITGTSNKAVKKGLLLTKPGLAVFAIRVPIKVNIMMTVIMAGKNSPSAF